MSDPIRLLDETSSPALAEVLRSAANDAPEQPENKIERITAAAALVIGGGAAATSPFWMRRTTWVAIGSALVIAGGALWLSRGDTHPPSQDLAIRPPEPQPWQSSVQNTPIAEPAPGPSPVVSMRVDDLPTARPESSVAAHPVAAPARSGAPSAELPDELSMIEAVRTSLNAGQPARALDRLAEYRRVYPHASFDVEGDVLEVQALAALGRTDEARDKARRFLAAHPGSPYEKRIQTIIRSAD